MADLGSLLDDEAYGEARRAAAALLDAARREADRGADRAACVAAAEAAERALTALLLGMGAAVEASRHELNALATEVARAVDADLGVLGGTLARLSAHHPARPEPSSGDYERPFEPPADATAEPPGGLAGTPVPAEAGQTIADAESVVSFVDDVWGRLRAVVDDEEA